MRFLGRLGSSATPGETILPGCNPEEYVDPPTRGWGSEPTFAPQIKPDSKTQVLLLPFGKTKPALVCWSLTPAVPLSRRTVEMLLISRYVDTGSPVTLGVLEGAWVGPFPPFLTDSALVA